MSDEVTSSQVDAFVHYFGFKCGDTIDNDQSTRVAGFDSLSACEERCFAMEECKAFDWNGSSKNVCNILEYPVANEDILPVLDLDTKSDRVCGARRRLGKGERIEKESMNALVKNSDILDPIGETKDARSLEAATKSAEYESPENIPLATKSDEMIAREMQMQLSSFRIMTSYFGESKPPYCVRAKSMSAGSKLVMRHCDGDLRNYFHFDRSGLLRLSIKPELCLRWNHTQLELDNCVNWIENAYFAMGAGRIRAVGFGQDPTVQWLVGLNPKKATEKVRLYKMSANRDNESLFLWSKDNASEIPSNVPSSQPSSEPSVQPSSSPSAKPSPSPSAKPTPSPSAKPTLSSAPSEVPSISHLPTLSYFTQAAMVLELTGITELTQDIEDAIRAGIRNAYAPFEISEIVLTTISSSSRFLSTKRKRELVSSIKISVTIIAKLDEESATSLEKRDDVVDGVLEEFEKSGIDAGVIAKVVPSEIPSGKCCHDAPLTIIFHLTLVILISHIPTQ